MFCSLSLLSAACQLKKYRYSEEKHEKECSTNPKDKAGVFIRANTLASY